MISVFQITISQPQNSLGVVGDAFSIILFSGTALISIALVVFIILRIARSIVRSSSKFLIGLDKVTLLITVPKEASGITEEKNSIESIRAQIALTQSWFKTLGGLTAQRGFSAWLRGRNDHFSLEIVANQGLISFYVVVPQYMQQYMEQQLLAQYPQAHITPVEEYPLFTPTSQVYGVGVTLKRDSIFPVNTYNKLDSDPLNAFANAMSKIQPDESIVIQVIARSAKRNWHYKSKQVARELQDGKSVGEAIASSKKVSLTKLVKIFQSQPNSPAQDDEQLSPMQQEVVRGIEEKTAKAGLDCNIRIIAASQNQETAKQYVENVANSFTQLNYYEYGNSFIVIKPKIGELVEQYMYRSFSEKHSFILNTEELATIYHLPVPFLATPNVRWLLAKKLPAPTGVPAQGLLLGKNKYRGIETQINLAHQDRQRHMYMIGMTGTGKSALLTNLISQDIQNGHGVCVIDPHGSLAEDVLANIPDHRVEDVIYFNPTDTDRPIGLNMLEAETAEQQDFAVQEMISIFYKLVSDPSMIGPMFEHNMRNAMLTLMADTEHPGTIADIPRIFTDKEFQKYKVSKVTDPMVRSFWEQEMSKTSDFHKSEMLGYLISKVGRFVENAMVRNIIGQSKSGFNFRDIMDNKKILIVNLSKGTVGEINSNLIGLIIVAKLQMAALSRTNIAEDKRHDFYLYIDEFQNFITDSIGVILAEARKYRLNLIMAHQYLGQLSEGGGVDSKKMGSSIKDAIFGNVGTMISFRIGVDDAEFIAKQMQPTVNEYDLMNIEKYNAYVRLLVDNQPLKPFNFQTAAPPIGNPQRLQEIKELSRWKYGVERQSIENEILKRTQLGKVVQSPTEKTL